MFAPKKPDSCFSSLRNCSLLTDFSNLNEKLLEGIVLTNPDLVILEGCRTVVRKDYKEMTGRVKVLSGGGSGLEPCESGYVGVGMLTAAVIGEVFTSPPSGIILKVIRELNQGQKDGVLVVIKNYFGDRLNFGLAVEHAQKEGIKCKMLVVGDEVEEVQGSQNIRRGLAGSVLVYKVAGAMAECEKSLDEMFSLCRDVCLTDLVTASLTLSSPELPYVFINSRVKNGEIGVGVSPYGHTGARYLKHTSLEELINILLNLIFTQTKSSGSAESHLGSVPIVLLINNLGSGTKFEELIFAHEIYNRLKGLGVEILRFYCGNFVSSFNTNGYSVTILRISTSETVKYLDQVTSAPSWPKSSSSETPGSQSNVINDQTSLTYPEPEIAEDQNESELSELGASAMDQAARFACEAIISCERQLNCIDSDLGDNDTGSILRQGAEAVQRRLREGQMKVAKPYVFFKQIAQAISLEAGGSLGPLLTIFFDNFANSLRNQTLAPNTWSLAFTNGAAAVQRYGKAQLGERSMLDALLPAARMFESAVNNGELITSAVFSAASTAELNAQLTTNLVPLVGRSAGTSSRHSKYPDPGAHAVGILLRAIAEALRLRLPQ